MWSLAQVLSGLHEEIHGRLKQARESIGHPGTKGDASERVWLGLFKHYLPSRYRVKKAHVVDSEGMISDQIDVVIFDRQYSPFIFNFEQEFYVPAESVYAVFESKQTVDARMYGTRKTRLLAFASYIGLAFPFRTPEEFIRQSSLSPCWVES